MIEAEKYINLIWYALKKLKLYNQSDLYYDSGLLGLAKAINTYDLTLQIKFSTYAYVCIKSEILNEVRKNNSKKEIINYNAVHYNQQINSDISESELIDFIPSNTNIEKEIIDKFTNEILKDAVMQLEEKRRKVICYRYGLYGYPQVQMKDLGGVMGISRARVYDIYESAIKRLRKELKQKLRE